MASKYKFSLLSGSDAIGSINIGGPLEVAGADTEAEALHLYHSYGGKKTLIRNEDGAQWADEDFLAYHYGWNTPDEIGTRPTRQRPRTSGTWSPLSEDQVGDSPRITIRLSAEVTQWLDEKRGVLTRSDYIRHLIDQDRAAQH